MRYHFFLFGARCTPIGLVSLTVSNTMHHADALVFRAHQQRAFSYFGLIMDRTNFFNDLQAKLSQALDNSPARDLEKNVKAMLTQGFSRLDLVTREEFDVQSQVLAKTRAKLDALEARVAELEALLKKP